MSAKAHLNGDLAERSGPTRGIRAARERLARDPGTFLFVAALALYGVLIFRGLNRFPLYFFADEAIHGVDAFAIAHTGADHTGARWPLFFEGLGDYPLSLTVYLQAPLVGLLGKSVSAVRATTALVSLLGVLALYLTARQCFGNKLAWLTPLLLVASPFWYLHSRTGFEYIPGTVFFLLFLHFVLRSLGGGRGHVVLAALSAAAAFYAYTPARGWVLVASLLSTLLLAPTHRRLWRRWLLFCGLLALLIAPYGWLQLRHPEIALKRLEAAGYVEFRNLPVEGKIAHFSKQYLRAIEPAFWFTWEGTIHDGPMQRHVIPELPLVPIWLAPFALIGAVLCLARIRRPESRILVSFFLAVPVPAALLDITSHRCLVVGSLLVLMALIGLGETLSWMPGGRPLHRTVAAALCVFLAVYALWFDSYARNDSIRRFSDYGFYGLQIGSPQLFDWIESNQNVAAEFELGTDLFNRGDVLATFFLSAHALQKVRMVQLSEVCNGDLKWRQGAVFAVPAGFPDSVRSAGCPVSFVGVHDVNDPLDRPVIRVVSLTREAGFESWVADQARKRRLPVTEETSVHGERVTVEHPVFDIGSLSDLLDCRPETITRTQQINPARYVIRLTKPHLLRELSVTFANTTEADVSVSTVGASGAVVWGCRHYSRQRGDSPTLLFSRDRPETVTAVTMDVKLTDQDQYGSVHLGGIQWR